jgi:antitoxin component of RelBE/YafQ-DinJ toxin-antitoxin module
MQNNAKNREFETRNTVYMDADLKKTIDDVADKKNWSFSHACYMLLQSAIKEKQRKSKKNHSESENNK